MSLATERSAGVEHAIREMKSIAAKPNFARADLVRILGVVQTLTVHADWWSAGEYADPAEGEKQTRYLIREDADHTFALYLNIMRRGNRTPVHNHTTWACIAAVEGVEHNYVYRRLDDGAIPGHAKLTDDHVVLVKPGQGIALMPDDIHAVQIQDSDTIRHLHMYGLALEELHDRVMFDLNAHTYKKMTMAIPSQRA